MGIKSVSGPQKSKKRLEKLIISTAFVVFCFAAACGFFAHNATVSGAAGGAACQNAFFAPLSASEKSISLFKKHESDCAAFEAVNILPGDSCTQYYNVKVLHKGAVTVLFNARAVQAQGLGGALGIKVQLADSETVLYDGSFDNVKDVRFAAENNSKGATELRYSVTVFLDAAAGNEWQDSSLKADFEWSVAETQNLTKTEGENKAFVWVASAVLAAVVGSMVLIAVRAIKNKKQ